MPAISPSFFMLYALGVAGVAYQLRRKHRTYSAARVNSCDAKIMRHGVVLICDGTNCKGVDFYGVPSAEKDFFWNDLYLKYAKVVLGPRPWIGKLTPETARKVLELSMYEVFPECDWTKMPGSAPWGAQVGLGLNMDAMIRGIEAYLQQINDQWTGKEDW